MDDNHDVQPICVPKVSVSLLASAHMHAYLRRSSWSTEKLSATVLACVLGSVAQSHVTTSTGQGRFSFFFLARGRQTDFLSLNLSLGGRSPQEPPTHDPTSADLQRSMFKSLATDTLHKSGLASVQT